MLEFLWWNSMGGRNSQLLKIKQFDLNDNKLLNWTTAALALYKTTNLIWESAIYKTENPTEMFLCFLYGGEMRIDTQKEVEVGRDKNPKWPRDPFKVFVQNGVFFLVCRIIRWRWNLQIMITHLYSWNFFVWSSANEKMLALLCWITYSRVETRVWHSFFIVERCSTNF